MKLHHKYGSRELIESLNDHGFVTKYDEVLRFRKSAAQFVTKDPAEYHKSLGLTTELGPIFSWADNYDLYITTPNGMKSTHAMVSEFTQHPAPGTIMTGNIGVMQLKIPRLRWTEERSLRLTHQSLQLEHYSGPPKLKPPALPVKSPSPEEMRQVSTSLTQAKERDAAWLSQLFSHLNPVDWAGYNTYEDRKSQTTTKPKTIAVFGPLIDSPPSHPDTVLTTLVYLERSLKSFGMKYAHITMDLQLYIVACQIQWGNPMRWKSVIIHPGMMHTLMSFLGCIGFLMKGSGMEQLLTVAFGGIANIVNGKSWTNALRAYRMLLEVLLQDLLQEGPQTDAAITEYLDKACEHPTGRLWVDCLIRPTFIALNFVRAERQGDFLLQQHCLRQMIPYFFAAGHHNYGRYITWYLRMVQNLPHDAKEDLLAGAHVCRHSDGGTAVPADQFGEQTYIKQGKGQGGLKGISTNEVQVAVWINSYPICSHLSQTVEDMYVNQENPEEENVHGDVKQTKTHKEEGERR